MNFQTQVELYERGGIAVPIEERLHKYKDKNIHKDFLKYYFENVNNYYKGLQEYILIIKDDEKKVFARQKAAQSAAQDEMKFIDKRFSTENLIRKLALKRKLLGLFVLFRKKIYTIYEFTYYDDKSEAYKKFKEDFEKIEKIEKAITASIILVERRMHDPDGWRDNVDINLIDIYILILELIQNNKDILGISFKEIERLLISSRKKLAILKGIKERKFKLQKEAQIVPEMVHINNGVLPTHFRVPKNIVRRVNEEGAAGASPRIVQQSKAEVLLSQAAAVLSKAEAKIKKDNIFEIVGLQLPKDIKNVPYTPILKLYPTDSIQPIDPSVIRSRIPSPVIKQSQIPPLAPVLQSHSGRRRQIQPLPANAEKLLNYNGRISPLTAIQEADNSASVMPSRSHSFKSKSPYNDEKPEFDIEGDVRNPPEVYLIDNKDDGLCFLNAIFDYLLYSGKLPTMYERLLAIEELILGQEKYKNDISYIQQIRDFAFKNIGFKGWYDPLEKLLIPTAIEKNNELMEKKEQGQLIRLEGTNMLKFTDNKEKIKHLGHPFGNDKKPYYEDQRLIFAKSMKYIVALYILSYGKSKFTDIITGAIKNTLFVEVAEGSTDPYRNEWNQKLLKYFHDRYKIVYDTKGIPEIHRKTDGAVATPEDIAELVYQYVLEYMKDNYFFANQTLIIMFKKILFKKIKDAKGKNIPRFWLEIATARTEYQDLRAINIFERVLNKYRFKTLPDGKYIHTDDKYDNYISLLCDNNRTHYLLFLLKKEFKYDVFGLSRGGGKPKRPKTVSKSKSPSKPKTAAKPKRPKTAK